LESSIDPSECGGTFDWDAVNVPHVISTVVAFTVAVQIPNVSLRASYPSVAL
jgi:hypothetical protein